MIRHHDLLAPDQERACGLLWSRDRNPEGVRRLVDGNHRLACREAQRYVGMGVDLDDLQAEATMGLIEAAKRFDPDRGLRFSSHAHAWIRGALTRAVTAHGAEIRVPERQRRALLRLHAAEARLGQEASTEALAEALDLTVEEVEDIRSLRTLATTSADQPIGEDGGATLGDLVVAEEVTALDEAAGAETRAALRLAVRGLSPAHQMVLTLRFGLDGGEERTLAVIGRAIGMSRQAAQQRLEAALDDLREVVSRV